MKTTLVMGNFNIISVLGGETLSEIRRGGEVCITLKSGNTLFYKELR